MRHGIVISPIDSIELHSLILIVVTLLLNLLDVLRLHFHDKSECLRQEKLLLGLLLILLEL